MTSESGAEFQLTLFVSGATPRSLHAVRCVRKFCKSRLSGRFSLDVVDVYMNPQAAQTFQIVALPTLLKRSPPPRRLFVGDMSHAEPIAAKLGLAE